MTSRKVWQLYACLEPNEREFFLKWMELFNSQKQQHMKQFLLALACEFERYTQNPAVFENCEDKNCIEKRIWQQIYPERLFDYSQFLRLSEQLVRWLEKFIAIQGVMKDQSAMDLYLIKEMGNRSPTGLFDYSYKKVSRRLERTGYRDATYHYYKFRYEKEKQINLYSYKLRETNKANELEHITVKNINVHFYLFWLQSLFELELNFFSKKNNQLKLPVLLDRVLPLVSKYPEIHNDPIISLYRKIYSAYRNKFNENFSSIILRLKNCESKMSTIRMNNLCISFTNYFTLQANNTGEKIWYLYLYDLLCWRTDTSLNPDLSTSQFDGRTYLSLATVCARLYDLEENEKIKQKILLTLRVKIENLKNHLPKEIRNDFYKLAKAIYGFLTKDYGVVINNIAGTVLYSPSHHLKFRVLELIARFEMGDTDNLPLSTRSLIMYIENQPKGAISDKFKKDTITGLKLFSKILYTKNYLDQNIKKELVMFDSNSQGLIWTWLRKHFSQDSKNRDMDTI